MRAAVEIRQLSKRYAKVVALDGVSLEIPAGAVFGLIGPNGAGKTTLVKAVLAVLRPSAGEVRVLGGSPDDPRIRRRLGYLPERLQLPAFFKPLSFLTEVARLKRVTAPAAELERLIDRVGLGADRSRRIGTFSKGMRQRLGLAAAMVGAPELLVLDEPTDGIDPLGRVEVRKLLEAERARGATVLLNSHLLSETERVCDRVAILAGGKVLREGSLSELRVGPRWMARFDPLTPAARAALEAAGFKEGASAQWTHDAPDPLALNLALDRARAGGAVVTELGRETRELEELLAEAVRSAA